jgi:hypothetical protein
MRRARTYSSAAAVGDGHELLDRVAGGSECHGCRVEQDAVHGHIAAVGDDGEGLDVDAVVVVELGDGIVDPVDGGVVSWRSNDTRARGATELGEVQQFLGLLQEGALLDQAAEFFLRKC